VYPATKMMKIFPTIKQANNLFKRLLNEQERRKQEQDTAVITQIS